GRHDPAARRVETARAEQVSGVLEVGGPTMGRRSRAASPPTWTPTTAKGGANSRRIRAEIPRWLRCRKPFEAERHCQQGIDHPSPPRFRARIEEARRDHERAGAASEAPARRSRGEDREQRADGVERDAEEGRRVGSDRAYAVHGSSAADSQ